MLILHIQPPDKDKRWSYILADTTQETIQLTTVVGLVLKQGRSLFSRQRKISFRQMV